MALILLSSSFTVNPRNNLAASDTVAGIVKFDTLYCLQSDNIYDKLALNLCSASSGLWHFKVQSLVSKQTVFEIRYKLISIPRQ